MKKITKYVADDGAEFNTLEGCLLYEKHTLEVEAVVMRLPEVPDIPACGFANGAGYIQHDKNTFLSVRKELLELTKQHTSHRWIQESIDDNSVHPSYAGRIIDELRLKALRNAWFRISCTDESFREWGQPFYAANPDKAKQIQLNP